MSKENVEIVRRANERIRAAIERGELGTFFDPAIWAVDAEFALSAEIEGMLTAEAGGKAVWKGSEEFVEFLRMWTDVFDDWTFDLGRLIDAGDDRVVALFHQSGTGR